MKQRQYLSFGFKGKGFIFTMDVAVALVVVFALLLTANFFVVSKNQDPLPTLQLVKVGSDIVRVMEYKGYFDNLNTVAMSSYLENNLPPQYGMSIEGSSNDSCYFKVGGNSPTDKKLVISSKEYFSTNGDYCRMRYEIWLS